MKSISFSCAIALLAFAFSARPATVTYTPGTGVLLYPENFFEANSNSIVQAIAGAFPGTGDVVGPASSTTNNIAVFADATGKLLADGGVAISALATESEVAAGYEPLNANKYQGTNSVLTTLGTLNGGSLTNLNASSIASGTLSSNLLPSAVSFTTLNAGTINATAVVGDASGLTGINATNITAGTLPDARIDATIARTNAPTLHSPTLLTPALGVASATSLTLGATNIVTDLALKAPLASPALTGTPTVNSTNLMAEVDGKQPLDADLTTLGIGNGVNLTNLNATVAFGSGTIPTNRMAASITGKQDALVNSAGLAGALSDETGTGVAAFATAPTFTGATLNGSVVFGQSDLAAHSDLTNFVVNPTVAPYQLINGILTNALPWIRILHATNVAAGRQTTVLFCAGTNASVNVFLSPQFARNTNSVTVTTGQILPISFYGYGSSPTNVIATLGTIYTR